MLAWSRAFEKVSDYVPWAPWVVGGGYRLGQWRLQRHGGLEDGGSGHHRVNREERGPVAAARRREPVLDG